MGFVAPALAAVGTALGASGAMAPLVGGMALSSGLGLATNLYSGISAKHHEDDAMAAWQANAYPKQAATDASAKQNREQLGQARLQSYGNLTSNMAQRGFGSGSGLMAQGASKIEGDYLKSLGQQATELTKFKNTPMFGPPSSAYPSGGSSVAAGLGEGVNSLSQAMGFLTAMNFLGGNKGGGTGVVGNTNTAFDPFNFPLG